MRTIRSNSSPLGKLLARTANQSNSLGASNLAALGAHTGPSSGAVSRKSTKVIDKTIIPFIEGKSEVGGDATVI